MRGSRAGGGRLVLPALIVILATARGLLWTQLLPPWYGPDELAHFDYVQELALTGRSPAHGNPRADLADTPPEVVCSTGRLGWGDGGPFYARPPFVSSARACQAPPGEAGRLPAHLTNPAATYTPLYYGLAVPFWAAAAGRPVEVRVEAVRLLSVILGALAALAGYLAAYWAFLGRRPPAAVAATVFTLQPMLSQQTAVVNNDALVLALGAAFFWRLMRAVARQPGAMDMAILGGIAGLAYLAKPQGALLALLVPLAPLPHLIRAGRGLAALRGALAGLLAAAAVAALLALAGLAGQHLLHGSPMPVPPLGAAPRHAFRDYLGLLRERDYHYLLFLFVQSFWGVFAWLSVPLPAAVYQALVGVCALAGAGLVAGVSARALAPWPIAVALASVALVSAGLLASEAIFFAESGVRFLQGRAFLLALVPAAILLTGGLGALAPRRLRGLALALICTAALGLQVVSWLALLEGLFA